MVTLVELGVLSKAFGVPWKFDGRLGLGGEPKPRGRFQV